MNQLQAKANYSRICQLLVGKGGDALRVTFHVMHHPSTLAAVFNSQISVLKKLQHRVITPSQWDLLFPALGRPDSNKFDITLLTILLRNICGLSAPTAGWNVMPPTGETSTPADIVRIKIFRNQVYGHIASPQLDDTTFETLWQEISKPLVNLGISQQDIDEAKVAPLSPEEESYIEKLKQWKELEDDILSKLNEVEREVNDVRDEVSILRKTVENQIPSQIDKLAKFNFTGKIKALCNKFQHGTRKWFFDKLSNWFDDELSTVMILTAGPGVGKSVLFAKVCELYKERNQLAACHFCDFKNSDYSNPHRILHSLASQMCDNIEGFRDKLTEVLSREHSRDSLSDAFRVLLNDPLHALDRHEPVLIVVDALDESKNDVKSDFLELISEEFPELPQWVKILISSRPEMQVRKKLQHFNHIEIRCDDPCDHDSDDFEDSSDSEDSKDFALGSIEILTDDRYHTRDLKLYVQQCFPNLKEGAVNCLVSKCEGSFLYAYYLVNDLQKRDLGIEPNLDEFVPKGISGFYEKQFKRLQTELLNAIPATGSSVLKSIVNVLAASKHPLPIKILFAAMNWSSKDYNVREIIISVMSEILPLYEDCLTLYHKSLFDWLTLNGYEQHGFVADVQDGVERLWRACKGVYQDIDCLKSISHFETTPEKMFALQNGGQFLLDVGDADDFPWLVHFRLNFLKLQFFNSLNVDISHILRLYKSKRPNLHYWSIIHLQNFSKIIEYELGDPDAPLDILNEIQQLPIYLQSLANGYFDFMQRCDNGRNEARDVLSESNQMWLEEIGNEYIPKNKVISHAILGENIGISTMNEGMALSDDKMLLAYKYKLYFEVLNLPSFKLVFNLEIGELGENSSFLLFSSDSSYLLWNSLRFCISLRERKVVPFIPHGPNDIDCCSFSSCGMKLVSFEKNLVKVWDLKQKNMLVQVETKVNVKHCLWSDCNQYILAWPQGKYSPLGINDIAIFSATSLERLDNARFCCADSCLNYEDDHQIISFSPYHVLNNESAKFRICHFHLPSGEIFQIANKLCSKPFVWKNKKCVIYFISIRTVVVHDYINQEVVELFNINCLPGNSSVNDITHLEGINFFVGLDHNHAFVLSLENSMGSSPDHFEFFNTCIIKCCALSPDNLYIACCYYEDRNLSIQSVNNGKILQVILLERPPEATWWSQLYLWVVSNHLVVKYPYGRTEAGVLKNALEDCYLNFKKVLKFMDGVLVVCLGDDHETAILKICDQKLCPQQISNLNFSASSAAISKDGCAVLLYSKSNFDYQLWEMVREDGWELRTTGKVGDCDEVAWFCLTGDKDSRSSLWMRYMSYDSTGMSLYIGSFESISVSFIDFPEGREGVIDYQLFSDHFGSDAIEGNYLSSDILIIRRRCWIHFFDVSTGFILHSLYVDDDLRRHGKVSPFYIPSQRMLVFVGLREVKFCKIHNIENHSLV